MNIYGMIAVIAVCIAAGSMVNDSMTAGTEQLYIKQGYVKHCTSGFSYSCSWVKGDK